jgi:hypothetical protein
MTTSYVIKPAGYYRHGVEVADPTEIHGYRHDDYLPGYADQSFPTELLGQAWIEGNTRGPDVEGIEAAFCVVPATAADFFTVGDEIEAPTEAETEDGEMVPATQTGRVLDVDGDMVTVAWDDGARTTQHFSVLRRG